MTDDIITNEISSDELSEILRVRRLKLAKLISEGNNPFHKVKFDRTHLSNEIINDFENKEGTAVTIAGRMTSRRIMGKASFCHILDSAGTIQSYIKSDEAAIDYEAFKSMDIGDIVGISGTVFKTRTGEVSIHANTIELLSKSLLPLPEKFHGLKDTETRYRQRYVDLIANPDVKNVFVARSKIIGCVREYLNNLGYLEVDTPILNAIVGGANARPFVTHHNTLDIDMYLRIAPELYLKRLIVGGFDKVYEIGRLFRNEGMSVRHNPEFTTVELYEAYVDFERMMEIAQEMFVFIADKVNGCRQIPYGEHIIDLDNWTRLSMIDAVKKYTGIDFTDLDDKQAVSACKKLGCKLEAKHQSWGYALYQVFDEKVEDKLIQPTFIYDYPVEVSPLAKRKQTDERLTERFEFFITAREMGNAFSELNDPIDQAERFLDQVRQREGGDVEAQMYDEDFVTALEYGMPPTGGMGIGIDRMIMLFTNQHSIRDVLLFPTMKQVK